MKANIFLIRCLSNMRVGNGEANYSLIDNEVERDAVLGEPVINSSGVKGALREHFEGVWGKDDQRICEFFGGKKQGTYKFLQATTLFRPLRVSQGNQSFIEATSPELLRYFQTSLDALGADSKIDLKAVSDQEAKKFGTDAEKLTVEGSENDEQEQADPAILSLFQKAYGNSAIMNYYVTPKLSEYDLPVQARNVLDDGGISKNLWFEEVVPHESIFWFAILTPEEMGNDFKDVLTKDVFQFGGSASVGYGLAKVISL